MVTETFNSIFKEKENYKLITLQTIDTIIKVFYYIY